MTSKPGKNKLSDDSITKERGDIWDVSVDVWFCGERARLLQLVNFKIKGALFQFQLTKGYWWCNSIEYRAYGGKPK